ncbi:putative TonB-dependent receptor [Desulfosarcina variabilis str. Montpellier]|uniref:TonB-dependent receptor plug domain-containing protein n=1 Tax=Desulfosarcina variabilis TaxID=2300 RepID=UPI003AFB393B
MREENLKLKLKLETTWKQTRKHSYGYYCLILLMGIVLAVMPVNQADADEEVRKLDEIVVTGVKEEVKEEIAITALSEVIELDELETTETVQRLQDLFNYMPGVDMIRTSTVTEAADPLKLRGFGSTRMAILLDGRPLNKAGSMGSSNMDWASLSLEAVEKVVVVRGGCTALYGGAIGGVINIITRKKVKDPEKSYEGKLSGEVASYDTILGNGYVMKSLGDFTLLLGGNHSDTDGYLRNNYFESTNLTGRLSYEMPTNGRISVGYKYGLMEKGIPVRNDPAFPLSQYDPDYPVVEKDTTYYMTGGDNYWDKDIHYFDLSIDQPTQIGNFSLQVFQTKDEFRRKHYMYIETGPEPYFHQSDYHYNRNETNGLRFTHDLAFGNHNLIWGGEYQKMYNGYDVDSYRGRSFKEWGDTVEISSVFIEDKYQLTPKLEAMLGLRYDYTRYQIENQDDQDCLAPKFSLNYDLTNNIAAYLAVAKVFRPPYANWERGYRDSDRPELGLADPDEGIQYETGVEYRKGKFRTLLSTYFYDMDSYIVKAQGFGGSGLKENIEVDIFGVEYQIILTPLPWLETYANYTYQHIDVVDMKALPEDEGIDLDELPDHKINAGFKIRTWKDISFNLNVRYVSERTTVDDDPMDEFVTASMSVQKQFFDCLTAKAYVSNIADASYEETFGYEMPGRSYGVNLEYTF